MKFRVSSHAGYIAPGSTYVAIVGDTYDGTKFIAQAIERGATTVVVQQDALTESITSLCCDHGVTCVPVANARVALAELSACAYDYPAKKLKIIGVTGTDGKTTSVYLLYTLFKLVGKKVALLSGVENIVGDECEKATLTTPKPDYIHYFFDRCVKKGIEYVVMEVSAQATTLHRIDGIMFDGLIFTNFSREHGECYRSLDEYFEAKVAILHQKKKGAPLVVSSNHARLSTIKKRFRDICIAGFGNSLEYSVETVQESLWRQLLNVRICHKHYFVETALVGQYNASNIINVIALADKCGIAAENSIRAIESFQGVVGRLEKFQLPSGAYLVVDYAHTPQAFEAILSRLKKFSKRLTVIFGAAGGKDLDKRLDMGRIADRFADIIILTNDNPKHEDPAKIMDSISVGFACQEADRVHRIFDRAQAIAYACSHAQDGDIVAVLGKGAETVQLCGNERLYHSDLEVARQLSM
jgi:UDP-N-acetylmuramoyl-L-alanyl-D-glutamate--2,6-diaminopimelate ligase